MTDLKKYFSFAKPVLIPLFHLGVVFVVYKLLFFLSLITPIADLGQLKQWDSFWYASIAENGYQYNANEASNSGFFPLFSYIWKLLWKLTGSGIKGICFLNLAFFFSGMLILKKAFSFSWTYFLLFVSIPSNMFMYVPYTEAVFFFFSAIMLAGFKKNNQYMILVGLFLASLTRPTAVFFIPAIICMEIFAYDNVKKFIKNTLVYSSIPLLGILVVVLFQYKATGVWFAYFKAQSQFWKRTVQLPDFPFTTWDGPRMLWLDGLALFFGLLATGILIVFLIKKFRKKEIIGSDKAINFSLCYLMMALLSVLFFNGKDVTGGTSLMGANRYLLATPYFVMMLFFVSHHISFEKKYWLTYIVLAAAMFFLLRVDGGGFASYDNNDKFYYRILVIINVLMYMLISKHFNNRYIAMIYLVNVFTQVIVMNQFVSGRWIG